MSENREVRDMYMLVTLDSVSDIKKFVDINRSVGIRPVIKGMNGGRVFGNSVIQMLMADLQSPVLMELSGEDSQIEALEEMYQKGGISYEPVTKTQRGGGEEILRWKKMMAVYGLSPKAV